MQTLRVSATDIDALRYYRADEDADLADLLAQLRRQCPPTDSMLAGTAFHKALETVSEGAVNVLHADGYEFELDLEEEIDLPAIREIKATRDYVVGDVVVTLVGKVDAVLGRRIDDHKLTGSFDAERYLGSYQWRIYLEVFGADEFRWNVFEGAASTVSHRQWRVRSLHKLPTYRYPGIAADVEREVAAFVDFARIHLPEKFERAAA